MSGNKLILAIRSIRLQINCLILRQSTFHRIRGHNAYHDVFELRSELQTRKLVVLPTFNESHGRVLPQCLEYVLILVHLSHTGSFHGPRPKRFKVTTHRWRGFSGAPFNSILPECVDA